MDSSAQIFETIAGEIGAEPRQVAAAVALLDEGASRGIRPYGLAAVESLRIESGLIFIGYDYFQGLTSPFHMNLDRTINLETGDFVGKQALVDELPDDCRIACHVSALERADVESGIACGEEPVTLLIGVEHAVPQGRFEPRLHGPAPSRALAERVADPDRTVGRGGDPRAASAAAFCRRTNR